MFLKAEFPSTTEKIFYYTMFGEQGCVQLHAVHRSIWQPNCRSWCMTSHNSKMKTMFYIWCDITEADSDSLQTSRYPSCIRRPSEASNLELPSESIIHANLSQKFPMGLLRSKANNLTLAVIIGLGGARMCHMLLWNDGMSVLDPC